MTSHSSGQGSCFVFNIIYLFSKTYNLLSNANNILFHADTFSSHVVTMYENTYDCYQL